MKKYLFIFFTILLSTVCQAQTRPKTIISPFVDTTFTGFSEIYHLWESYLDDLNKVSAKNSYLLNQFPDQLLKYWDQNEIDQYKFPDLFYSFKRSFGNVFYPMEKEYLLGIVKREEDLFELRSMFTTYPEEVYKGMPSYIITVPIKKQGGTYKLTNPFTYNRTRLEKQEIGLIRYYYDRDYDFNKEKALAMQVKIQSFMEGFDINFNDTITYILSKNLTEAASLFGVQHYDMDFLIGLNMYEGRAVKTNNMIVTGGTGEDHFHEIIHLLLIELGERSSYHWFEEGVATYFGGSLMNDYQFHIKRLKHYLSINQWVDLSGSLSVYYHDDEGNIHFGSSSETHAGQNQYYSDKEMKSNFIYTIHAAIVDIAYRQGGYEKVKELYLCHADNEEDFYQCVEDILLIKRQDLNEYIRSFINIHY